MIIYFGSLQKKLLIPLLFPIFLKLRRFFRSEGDKYKTGFFIGYLDFLSFMACGIFYLILKIKLNNSSKNIEKVNTFSINNREYRLNSKVNNNENECDNSEKSLNAMKQIENEIEMEKIKNEKKIKRHKILLVILISLLLLTATTIKNIWTKDLIKPLRYNIANLLQLLFLVTFSMIFLKFTLYSHQIISVIVIAICFLIFFVESIVYNKIKVSPIIKNIMFHGSTQFFYCLYDVIGKIYLNKYFDNLYLFLFKIGFVGTILLTIYGIISTFINLDEDYRIFHVFKLIPFYYILLDLFFSCLFELGLWLTIYYFSPCHFIIYETVADILELLTSRTNLTKGQIISFFILYPILFFDVFVFNEIIILNFCGLNYNTKIEIMKREKKDLENHERLTPTVFEEENDNI